MAEILVPRPAATVLTLRERPNGYEILMLRRNLNSDFVGGAYVFPGGGVDPSDAGAAASEDAAAAASSALSAGLLQAARRKMTLTVNHTRIANLRFKSDHESVIDLRGGALCPGRNCGVIRSFPGRLAKAA